MKINKGERKTEENNIKNKEKFLTNFRGRVFRPIGQTYSPGEKNESQREGGGGLYDGNAQYISLPILKVSYYVKRMKTS